MGFKAVHYSEVRQDKALEKGAEGVKIRWLINHNDGAPNFAMRYFEMAPEGHSPHHSHSWEHEVFFLEGDCMVVCGDQKRNVKPGYVVFIPPNTIHHFENVGKTTVKFLCLVPHHK
jgi:quercetin dioxygenase-like cupin family protein